MKRNDRQRPAGPSGEARRFLEAALVLGALMLAAANTDGALRVALLVCLLPALALALTPGRQAPEEVAQTRAPLPDASPSSDAATAQADASAHETARLQKTGLTAGLDDSPGATAILRASDQEDHGPLVDAGPDVPSGNGRDASAEPEPRTDEPGFDYEGFSGRLLESADPLDELKLFVRGVRKRRQRRDADFPSPYERFVARMLTEAGLFASDVELPQMRVIRPPASGMLYLRTAEPLTSYEVRARVLAIEAALNAARLSAAYFDRPHDETMAEHYRLVQRIARSICAQSPNLDARVPIIEDERPDSEWAVRLGISTAIESLQLPHRLEASFRTNVADGNVAIAIELPPEAALPASSYVEGAGLVPTTRDQRRRASADYGLRLALLVAACAFRCSERILHVWVTASQQSATRHACYLSVDFDRWRFSRLDLTDLGELGEVYRTFAAMLRLEDGCLRPVAPTFSLDEPRFCPPHRYVPVSLSHRRLRGKLAEALGTSHVSGLAIEESSMRAYLASSLLSKVGVSTEQSVQAILELAGDDPDPSVRSAAERCVRKLIEGSIADDANSIAREFVSGDDLSTAVRYAHDAIRNQDLDEARRVLREALSPIDQAGLYLDSPTVEYRHFGSYVDRALYNRLFSLPGHTALLVPNSYYEAHLLLSAALLMGGDMAGALEHARRLIEIAPLDTRARLHLVRCLEMSGDDEGALEALRELLLIAHDAEGVGIGYYRMAFFQWQRGNVLAAQACYLRAMRYLPSSIPVVAMELATLALQNPGALRDDLDGDEGDELLQAHGIPLAPTEHMTATFVECARAALDAEVFPVARNFVQVLSDFRHDDILMGLIRSIEDAPGV